MPEYIYVRKATAILRVNLIYIIVTEIETELETEKRKDAETRQLWS
jgi:hypothetical protein